MFLLNPVQGGLDDSCRVKIEEFAALQVTFKKLNKFIPPENSTAPISDETQARLYYDLFFEVIQCKSICIPLWTDLVTLKRLSSKINRSSQHLLRNNTKSKVLFCCSE